MTELEKMVKGGSYAITKEREEIFLRNDIIKLLIDCPCDTARTVHTLCAYCRNKEEIESLAKKVNEL